MLSMFRAWPRVPDLQDDARSGADLGAVGFCGKLDHIPDVKERARVVAKRDFDHGKQELLGNGVFIVLPNGPKNAVEQQ